MTEIYTAPPPETPSPDLPDRALERRYVSHQAVPLAALGCFPMDPHNRNCKTWLRESGELVLTYTAESWLFLWLIDVTKGEAHTRVAWPLGEWLSWHYAIAFDHDTLWVTVHHNLVEISCQDWEVRSCRCIRDFTPEGAIIERVTMVAGSSYLWVQTSLPQATFLVEIATWKVHRHISDTDISLTLATGPDPVMCASDWDRNSMLHSSTLYRLDGTPLPGDLPIDYLMDSLARAPHGPGLLSLEVDVAHQAIPEASDLTLRHLAPDESGSFQFIDVLTRRVLDEEGSRMFVSGDHGLFYVLVHLLRDRYEVDQHLLAVSVSRSSGDLAVLYSARVPHDLELVQDRQARRVVAIFTGERGLHVLPLGRDRPSFDHLPGLLFDRDYLTIPKLEHDGRSCGRPHGADGYLRSYPLSEKLRKMSPAERPDFIDQYKSASQDDVEALTDLYYALESGETLEDPKVRKEREKQRDDVDRILHERHAEEPAMALLMADREAEAGRWHEVRRWLRVARGGDFQDNRKSHVLHLEGLLLALEGRSDEAFEVFSKARSYEHVQCDHDLRYLEVLTRPMSDPPEVNEWDEGQRLLRRLLGAIRTFDRLRASGDAEAALAVLDRPVFWQTCEVQMAARRAEIFLETSDGSADLFQKRFVLAYFREVHRNNMHRNEVHLPGVTWEPERIIRIEEQARDWLETIDGKGNRLPKGRRAPSTVSSFSNPYGDIG